MERLESQPHVVGLKQSRKAAQSGKATLAYIARDADMHVVFPFEKLCEEKNIPIVYVNNMKELAKACRIDVATAVAVLLAE